MTTYRPASAVARIADKLIARHHNELGDVRIEYVFRDKASKTKGKTVWGKARKIDGLNAYLTQPDPDELGGDVEPYFVVEIAEDIWALLNDKERTALVDHELSHCTTEWVETKDGDELKLVLRPHDVEEFRGVVERHGLWRPDLKDFDAAMRQGTLDLEVTVTGDEPGGGDIATTTLGDRHLKPVEDVEPDEPDDDLFEAD